MIGIAENELSECPIIEFAKPGFDLAVELCEIGTMFDVEERKFLFSGVPESHQGGKEKSRAGNYDIIILFEDGVPLSPEICAPESLHGIIVNRLESGETDDAYSVAARFSFWSIFW